MTEVVALSPARMEPSETVRGYLAAAISDNTRRAYRSDLRHFLDWGGAIPASDVTVAEYLAAHAGTLAVSTLMRRLAAISKAHTSQGLPTPTTSELVRLTLRGIRRTHGRPQRQVAAVTRGDLLAMVAGLGTASRTPATARYFLSASPGRSDVRSWLQLSVRTWGACPRAS